MGLTVNDALTIDAMKQAKVLAGKNGLSRKKTSAGRNC